MSKQPPPVSTFLDQGKVPPQAIDLEEAVLGALIQKGDCIYDIIDEFTPESFYKYQHQILAQGILNLYEGNRKIDMLTITEEMRRMKLLEEVGGPVFIMQLTKQIATTYHIKEHYSIVFQKYIQREAIRASQEILQMAFDEGNDVEDVIDFFNKESDGINEKIAGKKQYSHISQVLDKSIESLRLREKAAKEHKISGIRTPVRELDDKLQGWKPNVIVIAATSGEGKTAVALAAARQAASEGVPVLIFSLEMQDITLADRLILAEADVESYKYLSGYVSKDDWIEIEKAKDRLKKLPIYIDDNPIVNFRYIKTHSRIMKKKGLCGMIILDYIQLGEMDKAPSREREIANFMRNLVILKKEMNVPVIALSQLNKVYEDKSKRPTLANLRESGAIGQDADIVIFVYRPEHHKIKEFEDGTSTKGVGIFIIAKHRNGPIGDVRFQYNESLTKISNWKDPNAMTVPPPKVDNKTKQFPAEADDQVIDFNDKETQPF